MLPELQQQASLSGPGTRTPQSSHGRTGTMSEVQQIHPTRAAWGASNVEGQLHGSNEAEKRPCVLTASERDHRPAPQGGQLEGPCLRLRLSQAPLPVEPWAGPLSSSVHVPGMGTRGSLLAPSSGAQQCLQVSQSHMGHRSA